MNVLRAIGNWLLGLAFVFFLGLVAGVVWALVGSIFGTR